MGILFLAIGLVALILLREPPLNQILPSTNDLQNGNNAERGIIETSEDMINFENNPQILNNECKNVKDGLKTSAFWLLWTMLIFAICNFLMFIMHIYIYIYILSSPVFLLFYVLQGDWEYIRLQRPIYDYCRC